MSTATSGWNKSADRVSPGRRGAFARFWLKLRARVSTRWPVNSKTLPRNLVILLWLVILGQYIGPGFVMTDSVNTNLVMVIKGARVSPGELAVFNYTGGQIPRYYEGGEWAIRLRELIGFKPDLQGPRKGDGFIKYLIGIEGDRIEVQGDSVFLHTARGRFFMGRCKPESRRGVPLVPIAPQVIPPGFVYMWAPHLDALDSRYAVMGLVPASAIVGRGVRLW